MGNIGIIQSIAEKFRIEMPKPGWMNFRGFLAQTPGSRAPNGTSSAREAGRFQDGMVEKANAQMQNPVVETLDAAERGSVGILAATRDLIKNSIKAVLEVPATIIEGTANLATNTAILATNLATYAVTAPVAAASNIAKHAFDIGVYLPVSTTLVTVSKISLLVSSPSRVASSMRQKALAAIEDKKNTVNAWTQDFGNQIRTVGGLMPQAHGV